MTRTAKHPVALVTGAGSGVGRATTVTVSRYRVDEKLRGEFGIFGLADAGRVYVEGEESDEWHTAFSGGLFLAVLSRSAVFSLWVAKSDEHTSVLLTSGFCF